MIHARAPRGRRARAFRLREGVCGQLLLLLCVFVSLVRSKVFSSNDPVPPVGRVLTEKNTRKTHELSLAAGEV